MEGNIIFSYIPDIPEAQESQNIFEYVQTLSIDIISSILKPLELVPRSIDFGIRPAERFVMSNLQNNQSAPIGSDDRNQTCLKIFNVLYI
jgi:hypothetical protein